MVHEEIPVSGISNPVAPGTPNVARMYDYYLGGKDNYAADREAAERLIALVPDVRVMARENRAFLRRAVRFLVAERGVVRFLDIGTGIPTVGNTHEVAQDVRAQAKVAYVDNDPVVLVHARALLATNEHTTVIDGDLREPEKILEAATPFLNADGPWAIMLVAVLHFIQQAEDPYGVVRTLLERAPVGSYLVVSHAVRVPRLETAAPVYDQTASQAALRSREEIAAFFDGLQLVEPGLVPLPQWRPDDGLVADPAMAPPALWRPQERTDGGLESHMPFLCAVGRLP